MRNEYHWGSSVGVQTRFIGRGKRSASNNVFLNWPFLIVDRCSALPVVSRDVPPSP